jgi:hypothetical protein
VSVRLLHDVIFGVNAPSRFFLIFSIGWTYPLLRLRSTTICRHLRLCIFHNVYWRVVFSGITRG